MGRTSIEDRFAELSQWAAPTFHPAQLPEVSRRAKRRRLRRRAFVSAAIAVLVALPAWALAVTSRNRSEPIVGPTATPQSTALPTPGVSTRHVELPGVSPGQRFQIRMVDRDHGWLSADCEGARNQSECRFLLAWTKDRGRAWYQVSYPEAVPKKGIEIRTVDDNSPCSSSTPSKGSGGPTTAGRPSPSTPSALRPSSTPISTDGPYRMQCANRDCQRKRLVKSGVGPTKYQPPWDSLDTRVLATGADGRIWLAHPGGLAFSTDEGKTWQETGLANVPELHLSPNGHYGYTRLNALERWRLEGAQWTRVDLPSALRSASTPYPLDDGRLFFKDQLTVGYFEHGVYTPIPGLVEAEPIDQLRDGTLILLFQGLGREGGIYVGTGSGDREWTLLTY